MDTTPNNRRGPVAAARLAERVEILRRSVTTGRVMHEASVRVLFEHIDALTAERNWFLRRLRYTAHPESNGEELPDVERIEQTYAAVMLAMYGKQFSTPDHSPSSAEGGEA